MDWRRLLVGILAFTTGLGRVATAQDPGAPAASADLTFVVEVGNRMYPGWKETARVGLNEAFFLGDTPYKAVLRAFEPDFRIIEGRIGSVSRTMANPAAHVIVLDDSAAVDSSWAFLNHPPHFSPRSFFTFRLQEVLGFEEEEGEPRKDDVGGDRRDEPGERG